MTEPPRKKKRPLRKGTRSCIECRRRKTRCTYANRDGNSPCDGCQTRQTVCESQDQADSLSQIYEPTRERMDRLEVVVENLSNTVAELQRSSREPESHITPTSVPNHDLDMDVYSDSQGGSEIYRHHSPSDIDAREATHAQHDPNQSLRKHILEMVPSRDDVLTITASAVDWWSIHAALLPEPAIKSRIELVRFHENLHEPGTRIVSIVLWLIYFAITFLQLQNAFDFSTLESVFDPEILVSRISDEAEVLLAKDAEIGTLEGLKCAVIFAQLQKHIGRPKKGWILLRRAIAFAELLNLHSSKKALKLAKKFPQEASTNPINSLEEKANLWSSLCAIDRLLSLLLGLPTAASNFSNNAKPGSGSDWDPNDPHASTRRIISVQSEIANQIFRRDQLEDHVESYEETQDITRKLRALQKTWPAEWSNIDRWVSYDAKTASWVLFQTGHSFLVLRTLLPFLLKAKDHPVYQPQAMDCLQACRDILKRYYAVRTRLNVGGFISRSFDVHAFTASVILQLHHDGRVLHMSATDQALLQNAKEAMKQAPDRAGLQLTQRMVVSLNSIQQCLDGDTAAPESVDLKVPLLGDVTIRRLGHEVADDGVPAADRKPMTKISFNFDAVDDEWFLHDSESLCM